MSEPIDPANPGPDVMAFLTERHLATLTTQRPDGSPHVVPVGFTYEPETRLVRVITFAPSKKARNLVASPGSRAAVCQIDGGRWLTLEGTAVVTADAERAADGEARYAARYRDPKQRPDRVVIEITVDKIMGRG